MKPIRSTTGISATLALALLLLFALVVPTAHAADGEFDSTFGVDGKVTTDFQNNVDGIRDIIIQPDGKIVAVGGNRLSGLDYAFAVARYNPDGTLDTSFGGDGHQTTDLSGSLDVASAVAIRPDGKILSVGSCVSSGTWMSALVSYNPDGTLDTSFGGGTGKICGGWSAQLFGVAIQADGKIVASGGYAADNANSFAVYRFNADGTPDITFGIQGRASTAFFGGINAAHAILLEPDGKIVAAGSAQRSGADYDFAVARYLPTGDPDLSFAGTGSNAVDFADDEDAANAVALDAEGRIYLAGRFRSSAQGYDFGLMRFNLDGTIDSSFGGDGRVAIPFGAGTNEEAALDMVVQPADGKVVAAGYTFDGLERAFALARLDTDGLLDPTFGADGKITHDVADGDSGAFALAVQSDGKLLAGGSTDMGPTNMDDFALVRYLASPSCIVSFTDVPEGSTFYDFVNCIACEGIISGYDTGCETGNPCFRPNNNLTRGQLSKIVSNAAGFNEDYATPTFEDVPVGSTFHQFVERLADRSIISGYACGGIGEPCGTQNKPYFRPNANVTRGQTSKIVAVAVPLPGPQPNQQSFEDVATTSTFWPWIEALYTYGAISGYGCGGAGEPCGAGNLPYFRPNNNVTRGQSSKIVSATFFPRCAPQTTPDK